jgi:phage/plasmid primase-like uncharacterized protein
MMDARELAEKLNLKKFPRSWRGDCPVCSYQRAFSIRSGKDKKPVLFCSNGCGWEQFKDVLDRIGGGWTPPEKADDANIAARREQQKERALQLRNGSTPTLKTIAQTYLNWRGIPDLAASPALRFRADTPHPEIKGRFPAMISEVVDVNGKFLAIQRTFLRRDGRGKADMEPPRATLAPIWGGSIRLQPHDPNLPLVIGEGLETSASAGVLIGAPAWAALSAGNLAKGLVLPAEVQNIIIAADPDEPGERAAQQAAVRWQGEGRKVRIARPSGNGDFNDLLLGKVQHG